MSCSTRDMPTQMPPPRAPTTPPVDRAIRLFGPASLTWKPLVWPVALLLLSAASLALDAPLVAWHAQHATPVLLRKLFLFSEPFGHGLGVVMFALAVHQMDAVRCWAAPRLLVVSLGAGILADALKLIVVRLRPHHSDIAGHTLGQFGSWLPLASAGSTGQSFPSGHVAAAVGLAFGLTALYPRGKWLFGALAICAALQRLDEGSHYLSDVMVGATLGALVATFCLRCGPLPAWFDRRERTWQVTGRWFGVEETG